MLKRAVEANYGLKKGSTVNIIYNVWLYVFTVPFSFSENRRRSTVTAKELRRMSRSDLLELLLTVTRENERLREQLQQLQQKLDDRALEIENMGSLAEAVLKLNGVFEAAQAACDQYTENARLRCEKMQEETKRNCQRMVASTERLTRKYE